MRSTRLNFLLGLWICGLIMSLFTNTLDAQRKELKRGGQYFDKGNYSNVAEERGKFFFRILRDPATNSIPNHIREKELQFARRLDRKNKLLKTSSIHSLQWKEAGPVDVGGRTRAIAVDVTNSNTIIAGGVSGGIWKSTDNGNTWAMKSGKDQVLSVTSVAQDPRPGHTNTWYYSGGEIDGNSTNAAYTAPFQGNGVYKSTDNGETWNVIPSTLDNDPTQYSSMFDYTSKIIVSPTTGSVFVAANGVGIVKSTDGGNTWNISLGKVATYLYSDVVVTTTGVLVASLSSPLQGATPTYQPGIYKSIDDGAHWTSITPNNFPSTNERTVLGVTAANPDIVYVLTNSGQTDTNKNEITKFYKITISSGATEDRSNNLPDFTNINDQGIYSSQGNYDMAIAVKPDDENFVLIAGTSLFRSMDGFATKPTNLKNTWIGGYNPISFDYPHFHSDIHSFAFDPNDPNKMWWGNDGGLTYTSDITDTSYADYFPWISKNNGYNVTQFYSVTIPKTANDDRIMGGAQDNGTPYFTFDGTTTSKSVDESSGDGAWAYFEKDYAYSSVYNGQVLRINYNLNNAPDWNAGVTTVFPQNAKNQIFISPYVIDPLDENIMYYAAGNELWRNDSLGSIPQSSTPLFQQGGTNIGWTELTNLALPSGYDVSAMAVSTSPAHILYYSGSSYLGSDPNATPILYKFTNANTATGEAVDISIPNTQPGSYIYNIAVNPDNANEIIVVMSNYNIVGLYHSIDGGKTYTAIEGNLQGTQQSPGPSLRSANILPTNSGTVYYLSTSIGVFSTNQLNGSNTQWVQEGANTIGNVVSEYITSRKSDGEVAVATHGRGIFVGYGSGISSTPVLTLATNQLNISAKPGLTGKATFNISNTGAGTLNFSIASSGGPAKAIGKIKKISKNDLLPSNKFNPGIKPHKLLEADFLKTNKKINNSLLKTKSAETLTLDDGNNYPDGFLGIGTGYYFYWQNDFTVNNDFALQKVQWYMRTETQTNNSVEISVANTSSTLFDTTVYIDTASSGAWYEFQLPQYALSNLQFHNGDLFAITIGAQNPNYNYPAGYDKTGQVAGDSYYGYLYNSGNGLAFSGWTNLMNNQGYEQAAWLIRAVGNSTTTGNQNPIAVAQVSPNPASVNSDVTFDGSNSYDNDGQVVSYLWDFGDGNTSTLATVNHQYTQTGTYTYSLTVTDNMGAQGKTTGQINIQALAISRFTIIPLSGSVTGGSSQNISVTFNAQGLTEGTYQAQLNITSNGGNNTLPVVINVSNNATGIKTADNIPKEFNLRQNYPNPFNPSTNISYEIPKSAFVTIKIYNVVGQLVTTLVEGQKSPGRYQVKWNAENISSGIYFYRMQAGNYASTKKLILLK